MRILHVLPHLIVGGAERLVLDLSARQLEREGWAVGVASAPGPLCSDLAPSVTYSAMPGYPRDPASIARWRRPLVAAVDAFQPDVVHTHAIQVTLPFVDIFRGVPVVMTSHTRRPFRDLVAVSMAGLRLCDLVSVTEAPGPVLRAVTSLGLTRIHSIPNGVDVAFWQDDDTAARPMSVLWVGRLNKVKRPEQAIEVIELVAREVPGVTLTIVGSGHLETAVHERAAASPLAARITLIGNVDRGRLRSLYAGSRVILNTSQTEGLPMTMLEGAAAGCAPVAPALPTLLTASLRGTAYYPPGSVRDAAERVVDALLSDPPRLAVRDVRECEAGYATLYSQRLARRANSRRAA